jgi:hypothetical protein
MNTYQELFFKHGYEAASLFAYLVGMADKEGKYECSLRGLAKVTGLSVQQVRTLLLCYQSTQLITQSATHQSTQITICKRGGYRVFKNTHQHTSQHTKQHTKESPLSPPLDVSPIPPSLSPPIIPQESTIHQSACERFEAWLSEHCPYIRKHYKMMTEAELEKLKQQYGSELIAETCSDIENRIDLRKKYSHLYRTLLNWLKKRNENNRTTNQPTTREERLQQAAQLVYRLGEEANNPIRGLDQLFS